MADPDTIAAEFRRTYALDVPVLDIGGDPPTTSGMTATVRLVRTDGRADAPLFGPNGLIVGAQTTKMYGGTPPFNDETLRPETAQFSLVPNGYWFVPTRYILTVAGRIYQFTMPAADSSIITLIGAEDDGGGNTTPGTPGTTPGVVALELPDVASVADAAALANAQAVPGRSPIFARVTADFATWETGDLLVWQGATDGWALLVRTHTPTVRNRGLMFAWFGAAGIPAAGARSQSTIRDDRPAVTLSQASAAAMHLNVAYPDAIDAQVEAILVDGAPWTPTPLAKGATAVDSSVAYRLYRSSGTASLAGGVGPMTVELVVRPA